MRSKQQHLARQWSRMWPEDRALSKAIHQGEHDGGRLSLMVLIQKALHRGEQKYQEKKKKSVNS